MALGLGRAVVDGGKCLTFCPRYPRNLLQFSSVEDILANSQREFWALELNHAEHPQDPLTDLREVRFGLDVAESDETLHNVGSTYSVDNNAVYDGLSRPGTRIVSFAAGSQAWSVSAGRNSRTAHKNRRRRVRTAGRSRVCGAFAEASG